MRSLYSHSFRVGITYLSIGLMAAGTLMGGQVPAAAPPSQPSPDGGGWKRIGDPQANVNTGPQDPGASGGGNYGYAPLPQTTNPNQPADPNQLPSSNPPVPDGSYPSTGQQPSYAPSYGQAPYQQPDYQQAPYNQGPYTPPGYGASQPSYEPQGAIQTPLTIPAGTFVTIRVNQFLSPDHNQQGDAFSASLIQPLVVNGVVVAEPGQTLEGRVVEAQRAGRVEGTARLRVELTELTVVDGQQIPIRTQLISRSGSSSVGRDAAAIAGTAGMGAAIGAAAGWGTGAAIGAGAGAAVGVLGVLLTRGQPSVIEPEQALTFRIEEPVIVSTDRAPQAFRYVRPNEYDRPSYSGPTSAQYPGPHAAAPYVAVAPYGPVYGYPYYYPFYYGPSFSFIFGSRYYSRPYFYGRPYYAGPILRHR